LVWGVVAMLLIGAGLLTLAVGVQRRLVNAGEDPAPGRPRPASTVE
jgi:PTS system ascorbate-specific IIC component